MHHEVEDWGERLYHLQNVDHMENNIEELLPENSETETEEETAAEVSYIEVDSSFDDDDDNTPPAQGDTQ